MHRYLINNKRGTAVELKYDRIYQQQINIFSANSAEKFLKAKIIAIILICTKSVSVLYTIYIVYLWIQPL